MRKDIAKLSDDIRDMETEKYLNATTFDDEFDKFDEFDEFNEIKENEDNQNEDNED